MNYEHIFETDGTLTVLANVARYVEHDDQDWDDVSLDYCLHEAKRIVKAVEAKQI